MGYSQALEEQLHLADYCRERLPLDDDARVATEALIRGLQVAQTFYWSPALATFLRTATEAYDGDRILDARNIPSPYGFSWFAEGLGWHLPHAVGSPAVERDHFWLHALAWRPVLVACSPDGERYVEPLQATMVSGFLTSPLGPSVITGYWVPDESLGAAVQRSRFEGRDLALFSVTAMAFVAAADALASQTLETTSRPVERATRKRLGRQGVDRQELVVHVVEWGPRHN